MFKAVYFMTARRKMTNSIEPGIRRHKLLTDLKVGRMVSSRTNTPDEGAVEAKHFFEMFPDLRPVGPFNDPRNSTIKRFRLEGANKTGISYAVGRNITLVAVDEIKQEYQTTRLEREGRKKKLEKSEKFAVEASIKSWSDAELASSAGGAISESAASAGKETRQQHMVRSDTNALSESGFIERPQALLLTQVQEQHVVTWGDLVVDKLMTDHGLTQSQQDRFMRHVTPIVQGLRRDENEVLAEVVYIKYCQALLDRIYPLDQDKSENSSETELHAHLENSKSADEVKKRQDVERTSGELAVNNNDRNYSSDSGLAHSPGADIASSYKDTLERVNMFRNIAGKPEVASLYELPSDTRSGHIVGEELRKDNIEECVQLLKANGYTVTSPRESIKKLERDLSEEVNERRKLEFRVRDLEAKDRQAGKFEWGPIILIAIFIGFLLMILAMRHFLSSRNESSSNKDVQR
jgi:hypothetical protein